MNILRKILTIRLTILAASLLALRRNNPTAFSPLNHSIKRHLLRIWCMLHLTKYFIIIGWTKVSFNEFFMAPSFFVSITYLNRLNSLASLRFIISVCIASWMSIRISFSISIILLRGVVFKLSYNLIEMLTNMFIAIRLKSLLDLHFILPRTSTPVIWLLLVNTIQIYLLPLKPLWSLCLSKAPLSASA